MKTLLKILFIITFLIVFLIPGYTYFVISKNATTDLLFKGDLNADFFILFRLFGLYAFTLVWAQIVLGPFMIPLRRLFGPKVLTFHKIEGGFALIFATLHPLFFYLATAFSGGLMAAVFGITNYFGGGSLALYGYLGPVAWTLMVCTVITAIWARNFKYWRQIHFLNYLVFLFAFTHSFKVGTETQLQPLNTLYYFFALTFLASFSYRMLYKRILPKLQSANSQPSDIPIK